MGRWDPRFSDEQRDAVIRNMLEEGESAPATVEAAAAGELGLDPFSVSESTCRRLAREDREGLGITPAPDPERESGDQTRAIAQAEIDRIAKLPHRTAKDLRVLTQAQRILNHADKQAAKRARQPKPTETFNPEKLSPFVQQLLDEQAQHAAAETEGRPCQCGECHRTRERDAKAEALRKEKEAWAREWEHEKARRQANAPVRPATPAPSRENPKPAPEPTNGKPDKRELQDPRNWSLLS